MAFFRRLALVGFAVSALVHGTTFCGVYMAEHVPGVWLLHLGIFAVFVPAIVAANRADRNEPGHDHWDRIFSRCPRWMNVALLLFFLYIPFNFFYSVSLNEGGVPGVINGQRVLHSHGKVIRRLTPAEYRQHHAYVLRAFSGHWMFFYLASAAMLTATTCPSSKQTNSNGGDDGADHSMSG